MRIKGNFGYLSQQPDGRIESRPTGDGPWEQFEIEGVTPPVPVPPTPTPGPTPSQSAAYVAAVKQQLLAEGADLSGPCGAAKITKQVAWGLRGTGAGLLSKPSGNNCEGYAVDIIVYPDGRATDILGDAGNANVPMWNPTDVEDGASRWRPPVLP